jgi:hypothetical protein
VGVPLYDVLYNCWERMEELRGTNTLGNRERPRVVQADRWVAMRCRRLCNRGPMPTLPMFMQGSSCTGFRLATKQIGARRGTTRVSTFSQSVGVFSHCPGIVCIIMPWRYLGVLAKFVRVVTRLSQISLISDVVVCFAGTDFPRPPRQSTLVK